MMSDFMFPIYLATNKIQQETEKKQKGDREIRSGREGTTEDRNKRGPR